MGMMVNFGHVTTNWQFEAIPKTGNTRIWRSAYYHPMFAELVDLLRALDGNELIPHFQPIVELRTGRLVGFEVLARWQHPQNGPCLPTNFIALAEENGLVGTLASLIFRKAFGVIADLPSPLTLAVNVSAVQLNYGSLTNQLRSAAEETGFPLERLTVEITESALALNLLQAKKITGEIKEMGCRLSLDDFGTGYSSLGNLRLFPFDELKIDRSFVASMTETRENRKIVAAVAGLGSSLGIECVAEGVETEEQAEILRLFGCNRAQGWLYGRPAPASEIPGLIAASPWLPPCLDAGLTSRWEDSSLEAMPAQRFSQLQAIYDGAPVGLGFLNRDLRYVNLNRRLAEMNGLAISDHLGKSTQELSPEVFSIVEPYLARALHGEHISDLEVSRPSSGTGGPEWISLSSYQPARDEANEVIGISIAIMDITQRKRTEEALQETAFLYKHMAEICRPVLWTMDGQGKHLHVGWQADLAAGPDAEVPVLPEWTAAIHPADLEATIETMRKALREKTSIDVEYRVMSAERGWRWVRCRAFPRLGPMGDVLRWYGGVEDIDEERQGGVAG
jgi:PAS domain S-box-containing protein